MTYEYWDTECPICHQKFTKRGLGIHTNRKHKVAGEDAILVEKSWLRGLLGAIERVQKEKNGVIRDSWIAYLDGYAHSIEHRLEGK